MPADSVIKQLNLKTRAGKVKVVAPESSYSGNRGPGPPAIFPVEHERRETKSGESLMGGIKEQRTLVWVAACVCV